MPAASSIVGLRQQRGRTETVRGHQALDDRRRQPGLGEVGRRLLGQHGPQQLLAAGDVLALGRDDERLTGRAAQRLVRQLRAVGERRLGDALHLEALLVAFFISFSIHEPDG